MYLELVGQGFLIILMENYLLHGKLMLNTESICYEMDALP